MAAKLSELSADQQVLLSRFRDEWLAWGTCTERTDRSRAETAILSVRHRISVFEKPNFIWVESPAAGCLAVHFLKSEAYRHWTDEEGNGLGASLWQTIWYQLRGRMNSSLQACLSEHMECTLWSRLYHDLWKTVEDSLQKSLGDAIRAKAVLLDYSLWNSVGGKRTWGRANLEFSVRDRMFHKLVSSLEDSLQESLGSRPRVWASLEGSGSDSLRSTVIWDALRNVWSAQQDGHWLAFYLFCRDVLGAEFKSQRSADLDLWRDLARSCCWWWCYRNFVIVCERPVICRVDDRGRLQNETGPALVFRDGWSVHARQGARYQPIRSGIKASFH